MGQIRIAILDTGSIERPLGGQSTYLRGVIPHLAGDVTFWGQEAEHAICLECSSSHGTVEKLVRCKTVVPVSRPGFRPRVPQRLSALVRVWLARSEIVAQSDVAYVNSPEMAFPLVCSRRHIPVVLHLHGASHPLSSSRYAVGRIASVRAIYSRIFRLAVRRSDVVLSVDESGVDLARTIRLNRTDDRVYLIPSCYDWATFRHTEQVPNLKPAFESGKLRILFVGRLESGKGLRELLSALQRWPDDLPEVTLTIVGEGSARDTLEDLAHRLPVRASVEFAGWQQPAAVAELMIRSDAVVLPSMQEGLPVVVLESLACGTPVLACEAGDVSRVVMDGVTGIVLSNNRPETLLEGLVELCSRKFSTKACTESVAAHSCAAVGTRVSDILHAVAAEHSRVTM